MSTRTPIDPWPWSLTIGFHQAELIQRPERILVCGPSLPSVSRVTNVKGYQRLPQLPAALRHAIRVTTHPPSQ